MLQAADPGRSEKGVATPDMTDIQGYRRWSNLYIQTQEEPLHIVPGIIEPVSDFQIIMIKSGAMDLKIEQYGKISRHTTQKGHLFFNNPERDPFRVQWNSLTDQAVQTIHLYLDNNMLADTATEMGGDAARIEIDHLACTRDPLLGELINTLDDEVGHPATYSDVYSETAAKMIAVHLLRHHATFTLSIPELKGKLSKQRFDLVDDYIRENLSTKVTLQDMAKIACMSTYHFCRAFKRTTNLSPNQYVISLRIQKAKRLLKEGVPVGMVAVAVGYQSHSHFSYIFKRATGKLPFDFHKD